MAASESNPFLRQAFHHPAVQYFFGSGLTQAGCSRNCVGKENGNWRIFSAGPDYKTTKKRPAAGASSAWRRLAAPAVEQLDGFALKLRRELLAWTHDTPPPGIVSPFKGVR